MYRYPVLIVLICSLMTAAASDLTAQRRSSVFVTVSGTKAGYLMDLKKEHFRLTQDGKERTIENIALSNEPMSIGFVIDISGSIVDSAGSKVFDEVGSELFGFTKLLGSENEYFLIAFNKDVAQLSDWTSDPHTVASGLKRIPELQNTKDERSTMLYDALAEAVHKVRAGKHKKKVLVLISDGQDSGSKSKAESLFDLISTENIFLFPISVDSQSLSSMAMRGHAFLDEISSLSGGRVFFLLRPFRPISAPSVNVKRTNENAFALLADDLRSNYKLEYTSPVTADEGKRKLKIELLLEPQMKKGMGKIIVRHRRFAL